MTDRARSKALLGPLPGRARVEEGIAEGWITPAPDGPLQPVRRHRASGRVMDAVHEDRGG